MGRMGKGIRYGGRKKNDKKRKEERKKRRMSPWGLPSCTVDMVWMSFGGGWVE